MLTVGRASAKSAPSLEHTPYLRETQASTGKTGLGAQPYSRGGRPLMDLAWLGVGRISKSPSTWTVGKKKPHWTLARAAFVAGSMKCSRERESEMLSCSRSRHHHHRDRRRHPRTRHEREHRHQWPCRRWSSLDARACRARRGRLSRKPWWTEQRVKVHPQATFVRTLGQSIDEPTWEPPTLGS